MTPLTSLGLVLQARGKFVRAARLARPAVQAPELLVAPTLNPNRQRKGKSGEILRRGGK